MGKEFPRQNSISTRGRVTLQPTEAISYTKRAYRTKKAVLYIKRKATQAVRQVLINSIYIHIFSKTKF